jgi:hypothetical protein
MGTILPCTHFPLHHRKHHPAFQTLFPYLYSVFTFSSVLVTPLFIFQGTLTDHRVEPFRSILHCKERNDMIIAVKTLLLNSKILICLIVPI